MSVDFAVDAAQALLTGFDIGLSRQRHEQECGWRDEDRAWRAEDLEWRDEEREFYARDALWRDEDRRWRAHDLEQRCLDNGRWIWSRFVEKNRRDVEEKAEQLKTISNLSALIAGFAVVSFMEFNFQSAMEQRPMQNVYLVAGYATCTAVTFGLMTNAMVICSLMLACILKNGKTYVSEEEEAHFLFRCRKFAASYQPGSKPPVPRRTFAKHWDQRCESSWRVAFWLFSLGVPTFMGTLMFAGWLKFHYSLGICWLLNAIIFVAFAFWCYVQREWAPYLVKPRDPPQQSSLEPPPLSLPFDWHVAASTKFPSLTPSVPRQHASNTSLNARSMPNSVPTVGTYRSTPSTLWSEDEVQSPMPKDTVGGSGATSQNNLSQTTSGNVNGTGI